METHHSPVQALRHIEATAAMPLAEQVERKLRQAQRGQTPREELQAFVNHIHAETARINRLAHEALSAAAVTGPGTPEEDREAHHVMARIQDHIRHVQALSAGFQKAMH